MLYNYTRAKEWCGKYKTQTKLDTAEFRRELLEAQSELQRFAYKLTADKEAANDLLQEASLKALNNMARYTPETNFTGWVYTIMRNIFINNYRRELREQALIGYVDCLYQLNITDSVGMLVVDNGYDCKEIMRIVQNLPCEYSVPFLMYISGFKYKEIAERLALPLGTVKNRIFHTRRMLQKMLKDYR